MSANVTKEQALHWLNVQLEGLNEVRNLDVRNPSFRQWRQNTLTILQRIWPEDEARHHRFRKVPFSPPSSKSLDRVARDLYERGCAEARRLLTAWASEVNSRGVVDSRSKAPANESVPDAPRSAAPLRVNDTAPRAPLRATDAAPRANEAPLRPPADKVAARGGERAPGNGSRAGERPAKSGKRSRPKLKDMLGLNELSLIEMQGGEAPPPRSTPVEPPRLELVRGLSSMKEAQPTVEAQSSAEAQPSVEAQAPIEAQGLVEAQGPVNAQPPVAAAPAIGAEPTPPSQGDALGASIADALEIASVGNLADAIAGAMRSPAITELAAAQAMPPPAAPSPETPAAPAGTDMPIAEPSPSPGAEPAVGGTTLEPRPATGPRLQEVAPVAPRPVARSGGDLVHRATPGLGSYASRAFVALAADVEELGVPAGQCDRVRAALLDFAPRLDHAVLTWAQVSDIVALVMQYPELGRRALPLLLPHIYSAAA